MWSDPFIEEVNSELSQVDFSAPYQLFGSLGQQQTQNYVTGQAMQQPFDGPPQFHYKAWSDSTEPVDYQFDGNLLPPQPQYEAWSAVDYSSGGAASNCAVMWHAPGQSTEQTTFSTAQAQYMHSNTDASCRVNHESKNVIVNKIQCTRSENVTLDEQIEEQKRRNSSLLKQIADARAQVSIMEQSTATLYNEYHSLGETSDTYSAQLEGQEKKLKESVFKKQAEMSEIKLDAEMVTALRADRDRVAEEITRLRDDLMDAEIDLSNMTEKFQYELGIMVLFPFWKLEDEMDRILCKINDRVNEERKEHDDGDNDDDGDSSDEESSTSSSSDSSEESSEESFEANTGVRSERSQTTSTELRSDNDDVIPSVSPSSSSSAEESGEKTGNSDDFIVDESFAQTAAPKKQKKKTSKFARLGRCLRRLCCIPKGRKDE